MGDIMNCLRCNSDRLLEIQGKTADRFVMWNNKGQEYEGYPPMDAGIGDSGDDIEFTYCLDCGQIQDDFPVDDPTEFDEEK